MIPDARSRGNASHRNLSRQSAPPWLAGGPGFRRVAQAFAFFWVGSVLNTARMIPSATLHLRVRRYGCPIVAVCARVGLLHYAQAPQTHLRIRPSPLHHVQLLSSAAAVGLSARSQRLCANSWRSKRRARIRAGGLRGDAGTRSLAHRRAENGKSVDGAVRVKAARLGALAPSEAETLGGWPRRLHLTLRVPRARVCERGGFRFCVMPKRLKRIYGFGHLHFLTFSCYRRLPLLRSA